MINTKLKNSLGVNEIKIWRIRIVWWYWAELRIQIDYKWGIKELVWDFKSKSLRYEISLKMDMWNINENRGYYVNWYYNEPKTIHRK